MSSNSVPPGTTPMRSAGQGADKPWANEPDSCEWIDAKTGYACLVTRGPMGAWCGYVAVPERHKAHGVSYYAHDVPVEDILDGKVTRSKLVAQKAINDIEVHGGLTFAGEREHSAAPANAHWFGFDCAHAGDYSPKMDRIDDPILGLGCPTGWGGVIEYRTIDYAVEQCTKLAEQLSNIDRATGQ